jgi:hypothetical protein
MLAATTEETRRLDTEVADFLLATVEHASRERLLSLVLYGLQLLLLRSSERLLAGLLRLEVRVHGAEVTLFELLDLRAVALSYLVRRGNAEKD